MSAKATAYAFHHVVLPPKLPQQDDSNTAHDLVLLEIVIKAFDSLKNYVKHEHVGSIMAAIATVENLRTCRDHHGNISESQLQEVLTKTTNGTVGAVPLEVKEQNAGVLVSYSSDGLTFEFFELSPTNAAAMSSGRLVRDFPGYASKIPTEDVNPDLIESISRTLATMATQTAPGFQPQVKKNNKTMAEERDTAHPGMVTDFMMNIITALGDSTNVQRIKKHTREEVLWSNCLSPWRRSPLWLLLRVSLQLLFARRADTLHADDIYKAFMIFMLAELLDRAQQHVGDMGSEGDVGGETIQLILAKLTRRLRKLELLKQTDYLQPGWAPHIQDKMTDAHTLIEEKWKAQIGNCQGNIDFSTIAKLKPKADVNMELSSLDAFLSSMKNRQREVSLSTFTPTSRYPSYEAIQLPSSLQSSDPHEDRYFRLAAFERWVEYHLTDWTGSHLHDEGACARLRAVMTTYYDIASRAYAGAPVGMSIMYLALTELWIACDRIACTIYPLLAEYDPEVDLKELQCLMLPLKNHLNRLNVAECYVQSRRHTALKRPSIYRDFGHSSSFAVRYFDRQETLQAMLSKIEVDAATKRQAKCEELARLKREYQQYMNRYNSTPCETRTVVYNRRFGYTREEHSGSCSRCAAKRHAENLTIQIFEWPVSSQVSVAKATVFELVVPESYGNWRDASAFLITTVLGYNDASPLRPSNFYTLDKHHGLSHLLAPRYSERRIIPLSDIKSHTGTHRKHKKAIPHLDDDDVCLKNALRYAYYDSSTRFFNTNMPSCTLEVPKKCNYPMPKRSKTLERFMCRPPSSLDGLPANEVIASLFDCPTHFSIDEYKALSALPLGHSIIYSNILAQLAIPSVDWTKVETQCIVLQTVQQTGPSSQSIERSSHSILREPSFGRAMLEQLETNLDRIRENWESWRAAATFSLLARRLLSLASASDVRSRALNYLEGLRNVCLRWLRRLKQRVAASTDDGQRTELYSRATEVALLCSSTYDVEETDFGAVLQQSSAISILLQSSIVVQEHCGSMQSEFPELFSITLQSWKSLMGKLRILPTLRNCILANDSGLSDAVKANWAAFESNSSKSWTPFNGSNQQHWMLTTSGSLSVHFNILTGELLVNGLPLARLPADYMRHKMYAPLFRKSALEVVPTDEIGFNFSAKTLYHGYKLHFGMKDNDMLLCAVGDKRRLEMVPSRLFQELLPQSLVTDAVHWYDSEAEEVIFRPLQSPWSTSDDDSRWRLVRRGTLWRLVNNEKMMINIRSPTARVISSMLAPLEKPLHIHTSVVGSDHPSDSHVQIELIRLQISFEFRETDHDVRSRQFRDMIIDSDQTMGALVGMRSRLILRSADGQRIVLIPEGSFNFTRVSTHHPEVSISEASAARVRAYNIDETLGQITGDGSLRSRLILCYLHALTSHCLPDTLTGCTGTESAISILRSAAVRSVDLLTLEDVDLLTRIASVSAARSYYPQHLKVMQSTEWDKNLPSLSQHASLRSLVSSLLHQAAEMSLFHPDKPKIFEKISETQQMLAASSNTQLDQRSSIRTATYQVASFGAEEFTSSQDSCYDARDNQGACNRSNQVHIAAKMVLRNRFALHSAIQDLKSGLLREHFANATVSGADSSFDPGSLQYDSKWLGDASERIKGYWCTLQRGLASAATDCNRYDIMTWLCTMAYAEKSDMDAIQALAAAYRVHELSAVKPPTALKYELNQGHKFNKNAIRNTVLCNTKAFADSNEASLPKQESETEQQHHNRMYAAFQENQTRAIDSFVEDLKNQWPRQSPSVPSGTQYTAYLDVFSAATTIRNQFVHWFNNRLFMQYLGQLSEILARQLVAPVPAARYAINLPQEKGYVKDTSRHFSVLDVFAATPPPSSGLTSLVPPCEPNVTIAMKHVPEKHSQAKERLEELCQRNMLLAKSKCERDYVESLQSSCVALDNHTINDNRHDELLPDAQVLLQKHLRSCREYLETFSTTLNDLFDNEVAYQMRLSPRICTKFWLSQLHRDRFDELSSSWKKTIVQYALAVTNLQRAQRLVRLSNKPVDLIEELRHHGHSNWDVHQYPETLLIEAESGILVRKEQEYIASQMRSPKENVVLQLLMGGGKSTTILPILSAFLGDKKKLVRVVVAKPQSKQMLQMLIAKLGGLLDRRIYQMPFSRNLRLSAQDARTIRKIYEECIRERGVLLIQPEHILSFKLMAVECVLIDQSETAQSLLATQQWFDKVSCDCIDESDENFSVKFELIYTMGSQQSIELAPERWLIIQDLLALIPPVAKQVKRELPEAVDIQGDGDGRYPRVRFLRSDAADRILDRLATRVVDSGIGSPSRSQSRAMKAAILHYISVLELRESEIAAVEQSKFWTETTKPALLLLRGLFAGGVLRFIYTQKRYRVNFGLDNYRTPSTRLAVPYRSKDAPSPRSEFSHPDVVIILTLLAFYYTGLSDDALFDTLIHVLKSDQAVIHYDEFVSTASSDLPKPFRQLSGLSIRDRHQCITEVFPGLRFSRKAIDYYLSYLVFPKELKQFPSKLSASGWDLAIPKPYPSTGFSGTNDTLHLLPLGIQHLDLPSQHHTNAQVLSYLLMDETSVANLPVRTAGSDGEHLIAFIEQLDSDIRVILDCGASILEQNNRQVAETWLKLRSTDIEAVLYFEDEELSVLDRSGKVESFQTSPYAKMLDSCVVYLDESHTRGTDIAGLPRYYRAALTLGSQLTKDRLTQAAMRLRKLGHGQSVCFIIPEEIRTKIYERTGKPTGTPIEVQDVLAWAIGETWSDLKKSLPLWAVQGNRFESHKHLLLSGASTTKDQAEAFLEDEAASLETRYKPRVDNDNSALLNNWDMSNKNIVTIVSRCRDFEAMGFSSAALSEEQERELAPEIEEQRQVERPPRLKAYLHNVHADLKHLVNTGEVVINSKAWGPAFQKLNTTSAGKLIDLSSFPDELLVTADFMHTVQVPPGSTQASFISDSYQRPVQFLLTVPGSGKAGVIKHIMVISPHEANHLLPLIRRSEKVTLHIFAPRSNTSYASIDELMLYNVGRTFSSSSVSRSLTLQLNLFAGTLYLRSVVEYKELCDHLGLLKGSAEDGQQVYADGFIDPPAGIWGLKQSPVPFLRVLLMKIRREGEGVEKTHMGKVLSGVRLEESDFVEQEE